MILDLEEVRDSTVMDAGYDAPRIAHLLADLPVQVLGLLRSDRVMRRPAPSRAKFAAVHPAGGDYSSTGLSSSSATPPPGARSGW